MKRLGLVSLLVIVLAGGTIGALSTPSFAKGYGGYVYSPAPPNPSSTPWVGPGTPWVYYQGDWFLNGILYRFFGNQYGWSPYYAYPPTYIVRPYKWYEPKWKKWYQKNPHYWHTFQQNYPYWHGHHYGRHYDQSFYNKYHRGHGEGWYKGFKVGHLPGPPGHGGYKPEKPTHGEKKHRK